MIYYDLLPPRAICRRVSEGQYVVGSVVKGGAFCQGDNMSCSPLDDEGGVDKRCSS